MSAKTSLLAVLKFDTKGAITSMRRFQSHLATFRREMGAPFGRAIKNLAMLTVMLGAAAAAMGAYAVKISGKYEALQLRLKTVMGSAQKAKTAFAETFQLFVRSPMYLEPLIEARILLEAFGVAGKEAVVSVSNAAAIMGRDVRDVVAAVGSLEIRPLRRLGIMARKDGDEMVAQFRDKMGQMHRTIMYGEDNMRRGLLKIFDIKFGGGLEQMALTWPGAMSTFGGAWEATVKQFGDGIRVYMLPWLVRLNEWLIKMANNDALARWGRNTGLAISKTINMLQTLINAWQSTSDETRKQLMWTMGAFGAFIVAAKTGFFTPFINGLMILVSTQLWAFTAMVGMFTGLASFLVGLKIGKELERTFNLSGIALRVESTIHTIAAVLNIGWNAMTVSFKNAMNLMVGILVQSGEVIVTLAGRIGRAMLDAYLSPFSTQAIASKLKIDVIGDLLRGSIAVGGEFKRFWSESKLNAANSGLQILELIDIMQERFRLIGEQDAMMNPDANGSLLKRIKQYKDAMWDLKGWGKDLGELIGERAFNLLPEGVRKWLADLSTQIGKLPDVPKAMGLGDAAAAVSDITDEVEKLNQATMPLRGFGTGMIGGGVVQRTLQQRIEAIRHPSRPGPQKDQPKGEWFMGRKGWEWKGQQIGGPPMRGSGVMAGNKTSAQSTQAADAIQRSEDMGKLLRKVDTSNDYLRAIAATPSMRLSFA